MSRIRAIARLPLAPIAAAAVSVAVALAVFGWRIANPHDTGWLQGDAITSQFGWHQYHHDPAHLFPIITDRASYPLPMPTGIIGTIPPFDLLLKLFAPILPDRLQYFGPAFVAGVAMQALLGWAVLREATPRGSGAAYGTCLFVGAVLFATAPVLLVRFYYTHLSLALQWPLLLSLWVYLRSFRVGFWQSIGLFSLIIFVTAGLNPYTMMMAVIIYGGFVVKGIVERVLGWPKFVFMVIPLMCGLAGLILFGYVEPGSLGVFGSTGFGYFSSNFFALIDPVYEYFSSQFIPDPGVMGPGQYEGFGYVGVGVMFLLVAGAVTAGLPQRKPQQEGPNYVLPLVAVVLVAWLFAMSHVMAFGTRIIEVPLPAAVLAILQNFRSSGRFIAVVIYVLMFLAMVAVIRRQSPRRAALIMGVAAVLQVADLAGPYAQVRQRFETRHLSRGIVERFTDPAFGDLGTAHDTLRVLPPWQCHEGGPRMPAYPRSMFIKFSNLAMDNNLRTNSFYGGRTPIIQAFYHCDVFFRQFADQPTDPRTVYLVSPGAFAELGARIAATHQCDFAEGFFICRSDRRAPGLTVRARAAAQRK